MDVLQEYIIAIIILKFLHQNEIIKKFQMNDSNQAKQDISNWNYWNEIVELKLQIWATLYLFINLTVDFQKNANYYIIQSSIC